MIAPSYSLTCTERVLPRLALDFTTGSLDARVSVTRALNTATRVNSSGYIESINADLPRFDYDPATLVARGLLIEEQRNNLLLRSNDFANASWSKVFSGTGVAPVVTAGAAVGLDGTMSATQIDLNRGAGNTLSDQCGITQTPTVPSGTFTGTFWVRAASAGDVGKKIAFRHAGGGSYGLVTLTADWVRASKTETRATNNFEITNRGTSGADAVVSFFIWGAQLEPGSFASSYIPTTTTGLTRNADVVAMTSTNFSSWWTATTGGIVVQASQIVVTGTRPWVQFDDTTADNFIVLRGNITNPELYIKATTDQAQIDAGTIAANTVYGLGAGWSTNNCAAALSGAAVVTDTSATIPAVTQARLGSDGANYLNGWLRSVRYWPQRITNAEVQAFSKL